MVINKNLDFDIKQYEDIIEYAYREGELGVCQWNISKHKLYVSEKITGHNLGDIHSLTEFVNAIAYHKDKDLAVQDVYDYINNVTSFYNSTFRVQAKDGKIRWVLFSGKMFEDEHTKELVLKALIFDVSGLKLRGGHDTLTNLVNDRFFRRKLISSIKDAKSLNRKGALLYIEIDNYKNIINNYGFEFGDKLIKEFADIINPVTIKNHELAKMPGKTFVILIDSFDDIREVKEVCDKITDICKNNFYIDQIKIDISVSIGVSIFPDDSSNPDELIKLCDFALGQSRLRGGGICTLFNKEISKTYYRQLLIESKLSDAINNQEFCLYYQPQVDVEKNKIIGLEALIRWTNGEIGSISPAEFIPIAEKRGFIIEIGNWVLEESLKTLKKWQDKGYDLESISVNISSIELNKNNFNENLINLCKKYNIPHSKVKIEITERTLMISSDGSKRKIDKLIEEGFKIALDDFGTGYSNLKSMLDFFVHTLKIDKSLIDNIETDKSQAVIKAIIALSNYFDCEIIAEGVETKDQLDILTRLGCKRIQGYYFSRPLPESEVEKLLEKN